MSYNLHCPTIASFCYVFHPRTAHQPMVWEARERLHKIVVPTNLCYSFAPASCCTAILLHTLCCLFNIVSWTGTHKYSACKPTLLDPSLMSRCELETSSKTQTSTVNKSGKQNCNMYLSLNQATCGNSEHTAQMLIYHAQCTRMTGCTFATPDCPTFGPQRGPFVAQQSSVLHTLHLIQSQPSFFCTITPQLVQRIASPCVSMRCRSNEGRNTKHVRECSQCG